VLGNYKKYNLKIIDHLKNLKVQKILAISHDDSRTGAPIGLLHFIKWTKENTDSEIDILFRDSGDIMTNDFKKVCNHTFLLYPRKFYSNNIFIKILYRLFKIKLLSTLKKRNYTVIYSNTIVNAKVLEFLKPLNIKVITHLRELDSTIQHFGGAKNMQQINNFSNHYIAASDYVKNEVVKNYKFDSTKIDVVHEYALPANITNIKDVSVRIRGELEIPENAFVVGACGGFDWRKGCDFFVQLANYIYTKYPHEKIYFLWVGRINEQELYRINYDAKKIGNQDRLIFTGTKTNPLDYFTAMNVFFLTSREEPGGLVTLEAASINKPTMCFNNSGGVPEFVKNDAGIVINYLDVEMAAEKIIHLKNHPKELEKMGEVAKQRMLLNNTVDVASQKIYKILNQVEH
jgi:glycosyltransferase involved in cell wall biosynthesis